MIGLGSIKKVTARNADYDEHNCRYLVGEEVLLGGDYEDYQRLLTTSQIQILGGGGCEDQLHE